MKLADVLGKVASGEIYEHGGIYIKRDGKKIAFYLDEDCVTKCACQNIEVIDLDKEWNQVLPKINVSIKVVWMKNKLPSGGYNIVPTQIDLVSFNWEDLIGKKGTLTFVED